jgi:secernin
VCDTLCVVGAHGTVFGKNSDRPVPEPQVVEPFGARAGGGTMRTQYLELDDLGAHALLGSRPTWLWGLEHGVNEHRVAIGNERVWTVDDPAVAPPALIGMDLVRLGLERATTADEALGVLTRLLCEHGQGGIADAEHDEAYWSSFLVADPLGGWVLETSGTTWAARPVEDGAAISNRISLRTDWTRASADVPTGADFDAWRDPATPTELADGRLAATRTCVASGAAAATPEAVVATLRHHGELPWGAPGDDPADVSPPPEPGQGWNGVTVCMHVRGRMTTNASMVAQLPASPDAPLRAWMAVGSPCVSVYFPTFPPAGVPAALAEERTWHRFAALRDRVEAEPSRLVEVRSVLGPVETGLWRDADDVATTGAERDAFARDGWSRVDRALAALGV